MSKPQSAISDVAGIVQQLAVLLSAGVTPVAAWGYVAESTSSIVPRRVSAAAADAGRLDDAIIASLGGIPQSEESAWRALAAAWSVATDAGAPLAPSLRQFASSLRAAAQVERDIAVALGAPTATARIVMVLPAVGVAFGALLGFDTVGTLFTTPIGIACLVGGLLLVFCAHRWNRRLVAAAQPRDFTAGLESELTAVAVSGGGAIDRAVAMVASVMDRFELPSTGGAAAALELSRRAGVPAGELLRSDADEARREARTRAELVAAALSVKLMLPLGLCILPAFMLLGVVPLLVAVVGSTVATF